MTCNRNKKHAAHKRLQDLPESRQRSQVDTRLLVQAFVLHHFKKVEEAAQEGKHAHYPAVNAVGAGLEVGVSDGHPCGEVVPVQANFKEEVDQEHLDDRDDESHDGGKKPMRTWRSSSRCDCSRL